MKRVAYPAALAAALILHSGAIAAPPTPSGSSWSTISFEMRSWGRILSTWRVSVSGAGNWTQSTDDGGKEMMAVHELAVGPDGFAQVATILDGLPSPAPDSATCESFMPDQPYGVVRMTNGATTTEIAWNAGCMDDPYLGFLKPLREANDLVKSWGEKGKVIRSEPVAAN